QWNWGLRIADGAAAIGAQLGKASASGITASQPFNLIADTTGSNPVTAFLQQTNTGALVASPGVLNQPLVIPNGGKIQQNSPSLGGTLTQVPPTTASARTVTWPDNSGNVVVDSATQT